MPFKDKAARAAYFKAYSRTPEYKAAALRRTRKSREAKYARQGRTYNPRARRTAAQMQVWRETILQVLEEHQPQTVRQIYYQLVSRGVSPKTESAYNHLADELVRYREDGTVPWDYIVDNSRISRKPTTYVSVKQAIDSLTAEYRRDLWDAAESHVEIWCEKEALCSLIEAETDPVDVRLCPARGFTSASFAHDSAVRIVEIGKPTFIFHLGDWDPSGLLAGKDLERKLREYTCAENGGADVELHFERPAITRELIDQFNLPMRPTKWAKNTHAKDFEGDSVELDALPARELQRIVRECLDRHIDRNLHEQLKARQEGERRHLRQSAELFRQGRGWGLV
jgi:hypothetical protein